MIEKGSKNIAPKSCIVNIVNYLLGMTKPAPSMGWPVFGSMSFSFVRDGSLPSYGCHGRFYLFWIDQNSHNRQD